jgi:hypothetical protein
MEAAQARVHQRRAGERRRPRSRSANSIEKITGEAALMARRGGL